LPPEARGSGSVGQKVGREEWWSGRVVEGDKMKKITNYKIQITNKSQITMSKITNKKNQPSNEVSNPSISFLPFLS
jgi:hypothetical protein